MSKVDDPKSLNNAVDILTHYKRTGNVFINVVGETGLTIYGASPKRFRRLFIEAFKRNPKAVIGITGSHIVIHSMKVLEKYGLVSLVAVLVGLSVVLAMIPTYLLWVVFLGSILWMILIVFRG